MVLITYKLLTLRKLLSKSIKMLMPQKYKESNYYDSHKIPLNVAVN